MKMGNDAFFGENKYNNLPRVKNDSKPVFLIEPSFENASAEVCLREMWVTRIHHGFWYFIWKILTVNHIQKHLLYSRNTLDTTSKVLKLLVCIMKLQLKRIDLTELSLAFIEQQPFVTSTIIGATTVEQLKKT
jgi:hypothetical protein